MQILTKAAPAECSCSSLRAQEISLCFPGVASLPASRSACSQLPALWPSINSVNKTWGRICFCQRTLWIFSVKSDQHICTAVGCASPTAKSSAYNNSVYTVYNNPMSDRGKWASGKPSLWWCTFPSAAPDPPGTNSPESCWDLLAAEMPLTTALLLLCCQPSFTATSPSPPTPLPPTRAGRLPQLFQLLCSTTLNIIKANKPASLALLSSGTEGWGSKWAGLRLMSYLRGFGRGEGGEN